MRRRSALRVASVAGVLAGLAGLTGSSVLPGCSASPPPPASTITASSASSVALSTSVPAPTASVPTPPAPKLLLPGGVRPTHYHLALAIKPKQTRFTGVVDIDVELDSPHRQIFLHGKSLDVSNASFTSAAGAVPLTYAQLDAGGIAALSADRELPAGKGTLHLAWSAAFSTKLDGLYRVDATREGDGGKDAYAFTQFEAIAAREAFPCFDEPRFKTPFDVTLETSPGDVAIANTKEVSRKGDAVTFATTAPLPTYLLAFAVGPLDVVEAPAIAANAVRKTPLSFRGIAARGRGPKLTYALAHTPEIVALLEDYFGIAYPFDKLDVLAVPDRGGAMENAGAITFAEPLLLLDRAHAPLWQRKAFASVMAHELAHQWFGDLVTMPWWDDIWLNEAFATWMAARTMEAWDPATHAELSLLSGVQNAMGTDALVAARSIRQPIASIDDIDNAFDTITYQKGAGVISMFERWIGKAEMQKGLRKYLSAHAGSTATSADLLTELSDAAGRDLGPAFRSFLDRPGVPLIDATLDCDAKGAMKLSLTQSRYYPLGSAGDPSTSWQVPVCMRFDGSIQCELLKQPERDYVPAGRCPKVFFPNADAAGYFRLLLRDEALEKLRKQGYDKLDVRERMALADGVRASLGHGDLTFGAALDALLPLAKEDVPALATEGTGMLRLGRDWLYAEAGNEAQRKKLERLAAKAYRARFDALGLIAKKKGKLDARLEMEGPIDEAELRERLFAFMAFVARDEGVRKEGAKIGRRALGLDTKDSKPDRSGIAPELLGIAIGLAGEVTGDEKMFDALAARLATETDAMERGRIIYALSSMTDPKLAERARALALDPRLRVSEALQPIGAQLDNPLLREDAWQWARSHLDALIARISERGAGWLPSLGERFCDQRHLDELRATFEPRVGKLEGGPRNLASAVERVSLCMARKARQLPELRAWMDKQK